MPSSHSSCRPQESLISMSSHDRTIQLCRDREIHWCQNMPSFSRLYTCLAWQVAQRMGLRMAARLLDGGQYVVIWPMDAPLRTCGQHFVVDAYSQGALFLMDEVGCLPRLCGPSPGKEESRRCHALLRLLINKGIAFEPKSLS